MNKTPWPTWAAVLTLTLGAANALASAEAAEQSRMLADCRAEGLAGGLSGAALDAFVAECMRELRQVEIRNLER